MTPDPDELQRQRAALARLQRESPDAEILSRLGGHLAGPADSNAPLVPFWRYGDLAAGSETAEAELERLAALRFTVGLYGGGSTVASLNEWAELYGTSVSEVLNLYRIISDSGAMVWDDEAKIVVETRPSSEYFRPAFLRWKESSSSN